MEPRGAIAGVVSRRCKADLHGVGDIVRLQPAEVYVVGREAQG